MTRPAGPRLSVLDLAPIVAGGDAKQALLNSLDLARHVEQLGYFRYWVAEHHNMPGVASAATAVVLGYLAAGTSTLRLGAGGIMLPNHAPLVVAEQFGTLATLYPNRIDLGLGRAPGTDPLTLRALRRDLRSAENFPEDVLELLRYFAPPEPNQRVNAIPGAGVAVPVWLLGSSLFSARLAARLGLPFAFAAHFAPELMQQALAIYRGEFQASKHSGAPNAIVCTNVFAADSTSEARRLFTSLERAFAALRIGRPGPLPPPAEAAPEHSVAAGIFRYAVVGGPLEVQNALANLLELTGADEVMATTHMFDHGARLRSYEILAAVWKELIR